MAMTKAEKARMEELETALAMHWPSYPEPAAMTDAEIKASLEDIPRRDQSVSAHGATKRAARGWFQNAYSAHVTSGWSDGYHCNRHSDYGDSASRVEGQKMYATRQAAAMAMRLEMTREFARKLAAVDRIIAGSDDA